jgi:hypothetical protein
MMKNVDISARPIPMNTASVTFIIVALRTRSAKPSRISTGISVVQGTIQASFQ